MQADRRLARHVCSAGAPCCRCDCLNSEAVRNQIRFRNSWHRTPMCPCAMHHTCHGCRHRERPKRPWLIWLLDVLKQACSGAAGHTVGMMVAIVAHNVSHQGASECGWYFVVRFCPHQSQIRGRRTEINYWLISAGHCCMERKNHTLYPHLLYIGLFCGLYAGHHARHLVPQAYQQYRSALQLQTGRIDGP